VDSFKCCVDVCYLKQKCQSHWMYSTLALAMFSFLFHFLKNALYSSLSLSASLRITRGFRLPSSQTDSCHRGTKYLPDCQPLNPFNTGRQAVVCVHTLYSFHSLHLCLCLRLPLPPPPLSVFEQFIFCADRALSSSEVSTTYRMQAVGGESRLRPHL
jgi:hypothetical protein